MGGRQCGRRRRSYRENAGSAGSRGLRGARSAAGGVVDSRVPVGRRSRALRTNDWSTFHFPFPLSTFHFHFPLSISTFHSPLWSTVVNRAAQNCSGSFSGKDPFLLVLWIAEDARCLLAIDKRDYQWGSVCGKVY